MSIRRIKSYAKINLALNITGKLKKLHKIESIVSFVNFYDLIFIKKIKSLNHQITFCGKFSKNIKKKNTVSMLLDLLDKNELLNNNKFQIEITKEIPQKAGLGGGSMNSANILNFFIKRKFIKVSQNQIKDISNKIGSDVILGINPSNIVLCKNGDIKRYNKNNKFHILVVKPSYGCSTKYIYSKVKKFTRAQFNSPKLKMFEVKYLKTLNNDLEKVAFKKYPKLKKIKLFLSNMPDNLFTRMSGSGSSIVAYFKSKRACSNAYSLFKRKFNSHWCIISKTI